MSKETIVNLILDMIFIILTVVLVIVNVCRDNYGNAIMWNMSFTLWFCNMALDLARGEKERDEEK